MEAVATVGILTLSLALGYCLFILDKTLTALLMPSGSKSLSDLMLLPLSDLKQPLSKSPYPPKPVTDLKDATTPGMYM